MAKGRGERREFWRQHIRAWRQSGQRREAYCQEHGLNPETFSVWVGRLREEFRPTGTGVDDAYGAETATFVPVEVTSESDAEATGTSHAPIEIKAGGITLRVAQDADTDAGAGAGKTKKAYFWTYARDDRPWGGPDSPAVVYRYADGRGQDHPARLEGLPRHSAGRRLQRLRWTGRTYPLGHPGDTIVR